MKKLLLFIVFMVMLVGNSVHIVIAQDPPPNNTEVDTPAPDTRDLSALQRDRTALSENLKKATNDEGKRVIQEEINKIDEKIEVNPEYRVSKLEEKYEALIASTVQRGKDLEKKMTTCANECEILEKQIKANQAYVAYLDSRKNFEACSIDLNYCGDTLSHGEDALAELEAIQNDSAEEVRRILAELTKLETTRNTERKFNVSGVFTPTGEERPRLSVQDVVDTLANWLITLVSSIAVTALIIGGFIMIISGGDETRLELGKTIFTYSLIGLLVTLLSFGIITFIQSLFYDGSPDPGNEGGGTVSEQSESAPASPTPTPAPPGP